MELNEVYNHVRDQILMMNPILNIQHAFSLVIQEEKQLEIGNGSSDAPMAFAVGNSSQQYQSNVKKDRPMCSRCGMLGHTKDKCFKIHGYPPGHKKHKDFQPRAVNLITDSVPANQSDVPMSQHQYQQLISLLQSQMTRQAVFDHPQSSESNLGQQAQEGDWQG